MQKTFHFEVEGKAHHPTLVFYLPSHHYQKEDSFVWVQEQYELPITLTSSNPLQGALLSIRILCSRKAGRQEGVRRIP